MGTYMGAYSNKPSSIYKVNEKVKYIIVKEAKCLDYYHYHGSMGEWNWELTDIDGLKYKVDTWSNYENKYLVGQKVKIEDGQFELL